MLKLEPHNQSFIILVLGVLLLVWVTFNLLMKFEAEQNQNLAQVQNKSVINHDNWLSGKIDEILNYKYPKGWEIIPAEDLGDFRVTQIKNPQGGEFKIYSSKSEFFALEGLYTEPLIIGGLPGIKVTDTLAAVKHQDTYYTFDLGVNTELAAEFESFLDSISFQ